MSKPPPAPASPVAEGNGGRFEQPYGYQSRGGRAQNAYPTSSATSGSNQASKPGEPVKSPFARPGSTETPHNTHHSINHPHHHHHITHSHSHSASPSAYAGSATPSANAKPPSSAGSNNPASASAKPTSATDRPSPFAGQSAQTPISHPQPGSATSQSATSASASKVSGGTTNATSSSATSTTSQSQQNRRDATPAMSRPYSYAGMFGGYMGVSHDASSLAVQEREKREREARERRAAWEKQERDMKAAAGPTSPSKQTSMGLYRRPGQPPSPTASKATPGSAGGSSANAASPKASTNTPSSARPSLPTGGFGSLGVRSLPAPFGDRPGSTDPPSATSHHRTLSSSSNRDAQTATSPRTETARPQQPQQQPPRSTSIFGSAMPARQEASKSPVTSTATPSTGAAKPPAAASTAASGAARPPGYGGPYGSYGGGSFMGYYGGGFGNSWIADRERSAKLAREREKAAADKEKERSREQMAEIARQEERSRKDASAAAAASQAHQSAAAKQSQQQSQSASAGNAPRENPSWFAQDYYGRRKAAPAPTTATANQSRIEVLNTPGSGDAAQTAYPAAAAPSAAASVTASSSADPSVMQQVAPTREPRPYTYAAKTEPSQAPAPASASASTSAPNSVPAPVVSAKDREYQYTPRDKRPRMDAAVDDARRGASKAKRRKEDDKAKSPGFGSGRDLSALTRVTKKWPEVNSGQVEAWLKNEQDLTRVVARQVYGGADWTLARTDATKRLNEGGIVTVRVNGAFLGRAWVVRGEKGWDETSPYPAADVELGRGLGKRSIWGTDVYTDDSDLGLVLIHAGWIRWTNKTEVEEEKKALGEREKRSKRDDDVIEVTVRVVPKLVRYTATERNGVRTRGWGNGHDGSSIVVEGVKRVTLDAPALKTRTNRKAHLAELAMQRKVVLGEYGVRGPDYINKNGTGQPIIFTQGGPALQYNPSALSKALFYTPSKTDDPKPTDEPPIDPETYNLFTHDLEFFAGGDKYLLHSINVASQPLELDLKKYLKKKPGRTSIVAEYMQAEDLHFLPGGLALETLALDSGKVRGKFVGVEGFLWKEPPDEDEWDHSGEDGEDGDEEEDEEGGGKGEGGKGGKDGDKGDKDGEGDVSGEISEDEGRSKTGSVISVRA